MRPRKWILILSTIIFVTATLLYQGVKLLERNRNLESILIQRISSLVGGSFSVEKVRLGFFAVYLQNVNISVPLQALNLHINDIKVGFALRKLILNKGDFGQSIDKIIIVNPLFQVSVKDDKHPEKKTPPADVTVLKPERLRGLPVSSIFVKDGAFEFTGDEGRVSLGGDLDGKLVQQGDGLLLDLHGRIASFRRNLSISAFIAHPGERHRLSVRLQHARLRKAIEFDRFSISSGVIDGVCEFDFPDTNILENVQSNGHITIDNGGAIFNGIHLTDGYMRAKIEDSRLIVDSLLSKWGDVNVTARGAWDFADRVSSRLDLTCSNIVPRSIARLFASKDIVGITGDGWLSAQVTREPGNTDLRIKSTFGGITVGAVDIVNWQGRWVVRENEITLKALRAVQDGLELNGHGRISLDTKEPHYSFSGRLRLASQLITPELQGELELDGGIVGKGDDFQFRGSVIGEKVAYRKIRLENIHLSAGGDRDKISVSNLEQNDAPIKISGSILSPWDGDARVDGTFAIDSAMIFSVLQKHAPDLSVWGPRIQGKITGKLKRPEISGNLRFMGNVSGDVNFWARPKSKKRGAYGIKISESALQYNNTAVPLSAAATLYPDSVTLDSISVASYLTGKAGIAFGRSEGISVLLAGKDIPLGFLDTLVLNRKNLLRRGTVDVNVRLAGKMDSIRSRGRINLRNADIGGVHALETDMVIAGEGKRITVRPFVVRKDKRIFMTVDSLKSDKTFYINGQLLEADLGEFVGGISDEWQVAGKVSALFSSTDSGFPIHVHASVPSLSINEYRLGNVSSNIAVTPRAIEFLTISARDSTRMQLEAGGSIPWSYISEEEKESESIDAWVSGRGNLLAVLNRYLDSPIGGNGYGTFDLKASINSGNWTVTDARIDVDKGTLTLHPFVLDKITDFSFHSTISDSSRLNVRMAGKIRKRFVEIYSSHNIPPGIEPIRLGPINAGVLLARTPDRGIHLHIPGFLVGGESADVEFAGRGPFDQFAVSGPIDRLRLTGSWILRDVEFTFPLLTEESLPWPFDPFPYITWDMDIKIGNRNVMYFYDVGAKKRLMRVVEAFLDPNGEVQIRGRQMDKDFRLFGGVRSYRGAVYYGKTFNRNVEIGVDFVPEPFPGENGFENLPFVWGSAEAFSDTSRFDRIKLSLLTKDPENGALSEKGRFNDITFRLSSEFDEIPGESEREFYRQAGLKVVTIEGAGGFFSDFGEQYLHRYFLQRIERRLARRLGLDVISFETSIASNYFYYLYNNNFQGLAGQWDNLALANVGVTIGRYFGRDKLFLKWRTEIVPSEALIYPEHSLGLEYYPMRYLVFDLSYGFHRGENTFEHNPQVNMQLRLPIKGFRKVFDF